MEEIVVTRPRSDVTTMKIAQNDVDQLAVVTRPRSDVTTIIKGIRKTTTLML